MLTVTITNDIRFLMSEIPSQLMKAVTADLTLSNPEYLQALKYGFSTYGKDEYLRLYKVDRDDLVLPRGYGVDLNRRFKEYDIKVHWDNKMLILPSVDFGSKIKLRDYQVPAVEALYEKKQGGIHAPCGSGKTIVLLETLARIKQPALWITHTRELLTQTKKLALQVLDLKEEDVGEISAGKVKIGTKLTLALIQTLSKVDLADIVDKFGTVCIDEAHHLPARMFQSTVSNFPAMYRLWASATPTREDGLTPALFASGGPTVFTIGRAELPTLTPKLTVIETSFAYESEDYSKLITKLILDGERNKLIVQTIVQEAPGHFNLILSDRKEHLSILYKMITLAAPNLRVEILTGDLSKKARTEIMERLQRKEIDALLATQLAREGLDVIHLDRLFLTTPKRAAGVVEQEAGRIMRPCDGKGTPVIYDFWDIKNPVLRAQFWRRCQTYRKLGIHWKKPAKPA
jgi:superfamily II DNA or RNA helicase